MQESLAVIVENISKKYKIYDSPKDRLKEALSLRKHCYHRPFWALKNVSLKLQKGNTLGIMGINGSGKSTLLKIICGYLTATSGYVKTNGYIRSILELGTGFNMDFSGKENVILYGSVMGLSKEQVSSKLSLWII